MPTRMNTPPVTVTVDNQTILDNGKWTDAARQLKLGNPPPAWMKTVLHVLAETAATQQKLTITITTRHNGWNMDTTNGCA